jgi:hypothetical protein
MPRILKFEYAQNNNNARSGFTLLKKKRDDFATLKGKGVVSGFFEKKRDAIPPHPAPPEALVITCVTL